MPLRFGRRNIIEFKTENDFFYALGFLANPGRVKLVWENNQEQGAWEQEGRIQCFRDIDNFPNELSIAMSAGNGNILKRINCNEYVQFIKTAHNFQIGTLQQDINLILSTVPNNYLADFRAGLQA